MNKTLIKNLLIGFAVAFVAGFGLSFLETVSGSASGSGVTYTMPTVMGVITFFGLQMRAGNHKESKVDAGARQAALSAVVPPGQVLLYVYREGFAGKAVGWNVALDGAELVQLKSPRFTRIVIQPGNHVLGVRVGGGFAGAQFKPGELAFEAHPGEVLVFAMKAKMGALASTISFVREPDPVAALQKLEKIQMVASETPSAAVA